MTLPQLSRIVARTLLCALVSCGVTLGDHGFQEIHFPGSLNTVATDVDGGTVVGYYWNDNSVRTNGFLYDGTTYKTVNFPGAIATTLLGIDGDKVVGQALAGGPFKFRGFAYHNDAFSVIEPPMTGNYLNGSGTFGIDGDRHVGQYIDSGGETHGYLFNGVSFTTFDFPGGAVNVAFGIDGSTIVGGFTDVRGSGQRRGYLYDGTRFQIMAPQGSIASMAYGVDDGRVVGSYDTSAATAGFLYEGGEYRDIIVPPSLGNSTRARGIDGLTVVGSYVNSGRFSRGFITVIPEPSALTIAAMLTGCGMMRRRRIA